MWTKSKQQKKKTRNKQRNTHHFYLILSFLKNHFPTGFQRKNKASHPLKTQILASEPEHQDVLSKISGCLQSNIKVFFKKRQGVFRQSPSPPTPLYKPSERGQSFTFIKKPLPDATKLRKHMFS